MSLARCWESAIGLPHEVAELLSDHSDFRGQKPELLVALPEWKVELPGGSRASQNDIFALVRSGENVLAVMVEGKVAEPFGPTIAEWSTDASEGKRVRLDYIRACLGLSTGLPNTIRYQLLHRAASAVIEAGRFGTDAAAMIVHSFSPEAMWFDDFASFCRLFDASAEIGRLSRVTAKNNIRLYLGWAEGRL